MPSKSCDTRTVVETPEGVLLSFDLAGPGSRYGAYLVDFGIRAGIYIAASTILGAFAVVGGEGASMGLTLVTLFLLEWGYGTMFEGLWHGQTPGKKAFKLRVIKSGGYPICFYDAVMRNFLRAADFVPFGYAVGLVTICSTRRLQRIGDLAADTIVIHTAEHRLHRADSQVENAEPLRRQDCSRAFSVSERTLDLVERLFDRRSQVGPRRLDEIGRNVAEPVADRLGYDLDSTSGPTPYLDFLARCLRTFAHTETQRGGDDGYAREQEAADVSKRPRPASTEVAPVETVS